MAIKTKMETTIQELKVKANLLNPFLELITKDKMDVKELATDMKQISQLGDCFTDINLGETVSTLSSTARLLVALAKSVETLQLPNCLLKAELFETKKRVDILEAKKATDKALTQKSADQKVKEKVIDNVDNKFIPILYSKIKAHDKRLVIKGLKRDLSPLTLNTEILNHWP